MKKRNIVTLIVGAGAVGMAALLSTEAGQVAFIGLNIVPILGLGAIADGLLTRYNAHNAPVPTNVASSIIDPPSPTVGPLLQNTEAPICNEQIYSTDNDPSKTPNKGVRPQ